jgi:hypothetical protein
MDRLILVAVSYEHKIEYSLAKQRTFFLFIIMEELHGN